MIVVVVDIGLFDNENSKLIGDDDDKGVVKDCIGDFDDDTVLVVVTAIVGC